MFIMKLNFLNWVSIHVKIMEVYMVSMLMDAKLCLILLKKKKNKGYVYIVVIEAKWKDYGKNWLQEDW
jgi:hypothetical protein